MDREKLMDPYDKAIASLPDISRKGKTMPYTSLNAHMFSFRLEMCISPLLTCIFCAIYHTHHRFLMASPPQDFSLTCTPCLQPKIFPKNTKTSKC